MGRGTRVGVEEMTRTALFEAENWRLHVSSSSSKLLTTYGSKEYLTGTVFQSSRVSRDQAGFLFRPLGL